MVSSSENRKRKTSRDVLVVLAVLAMLCPIAGRAQPMPSPTPTESATPQPTVSAPIWHNPPNTPYSIFDPCAGPKEIFNKINPSPCVLVLGQAEVAFGYANINVHGNVSAVGPQLQGN